MLNKTIAILVILGGITFVRTSGEGTFVKKGQEQRVEATTLKMNDRVYVRLDITDLSKGDHELLLSIGDDGEPVKLTKLNWQTFVLGDGGNDDDGDDGDNGDDDDPPPKPDELDVVIKKVEDAYRADDDYNTYLKRSGAVSAVLLGMANAVENYKTVGGFQEDLKRSFDLVAGENHWDALWEWLTDIPKGMKVDGYADRCRQVAEGLVK